MSDRKKPKKAVGAASLLHSQEAEMRRRPTKQVAFPVLFSVCRVWLNKLSSSILDLRFTVVQEANKEPPNGLSHPSWGTGRAGRLCAAEAPLTNPTNKPLIWFKTQK